MIKAVLFDLDGTLVQQHDAYILSTVQKALDAFNKPMDEEFARELWHGWGGDRDESVRRHTGVQDTAEFWNVFWKLDTADVRAGNTFAYDDLGVLQELKEKGMKIGIVTSSQPEVVELELKKVDFRDFDCIINNKSGGGMKLKPHPDMILLALDELGILPEEAMYVGDSPVDVTASLAAGVKSVIVSREGNPFQPDGRSVKVILSLRELLGSL